MKRITSITIEIFLHIVKVQHTCTSNYFNAKISITVNCVSFKVNLNSLVIYNDLYLIWQNIIKKKQLYFIF